MVLVLNRLLSIMPLASIVVIFVVLAAVAIDVIVPPGQMAASPINFGRIAKALIFLFGTMFVPGVVVCVVYAIYARSRFRGRPKSYPLEIIAVIVAVQTVFTFTLLQGV